MTDSQREQFELDMLKNIEEAQNEEAELIAGQPDVIPEVIEIPEEKPAIDFDKIFERIKNPENNKRGENARILKCALNTQDYLGWLKGMELQSKLDSDHFGTGFYQGLYQKFVTENTP